MKNLKSTIKYPPQYILLGLLGIFFINFTACSHRKSGVQTKPIINGKNRLVDLKDWQFFKPKEMILTIETIYPNSQATSQSNQAHLYKCKEIIDEKNARTFYVFVVGELSQPPEQSDHRYIEYLPKLDEQALYRPKETSFNVVLPKDQYIPEGARYVFGKITWIPNIDCGN